MLCGERLPGESYSMAEDVGCGDRCTQGAGLDDARGIGYGDVRAGANHIDALALGRWCVPQGRLLRVICSS